MSFNSDSSEDYKIRIKRLENIKVGDFLYKEPELENGLMLRTWSGAARLGVTLYSRIAIRVANSNIVPFGQLAEWIKLFVPLAYAPWFRAVTP